MSKPCILVIVIVFLATSLIAKQAISTDSPTYVYHDCHTTAGNFTDNSTYETELKTVLSGLQQQALLASPYFNNSAGGGEEKVYGQYYCRGNVGPQLCSDCVQAAAQFILTACMHYKAALAWYEECTLRYDNESMFNRVNSTGLLPGWYSLQNMTSDPQKSLGVYNDTMYRIINEAAYGHDLRRFAEGTANLSESDTLYCQVQCSPDLNGTLCAVCLQSIVHLSLEVWGHIYLHVFFSNCQMMYNITTTFYSISPSSQPPYSQLPPSQTIGSDTNCDPKSPHSYCGPENKQPVAVFVAVPVAVAVLLLLSVVGFLLYRRNRRHAAYRHMNHDLENVESLQYDISTIRTATSNFADASKLGQGGFGSVYKGKLQNGQEIAVKRLFQKADQQGVEEFKTEVLVVAKLQHRNLVKLLGYCLTGREKLLIFELLPNSSLDHFFKDAVKRASLDWKTRYKIMAGVARGLLYLHEESRLKIIHRDLKPHNILLDEDMNAKIADFGLAKSFNLDQSMANTNNIVGTYGYMSPEYAMTGHFSTKSDIYSFGVIVLEIVTGRRNIIQANQPSLFHHAWKLWNEENALDMVDPTLQNNYSTEEAMTCIQIGLLCIQDEPGLRPTMAKVASVLNGHSTDLPKPSPPLIFSFTEGGSGINYSSTLTTQGSEEHYTSGTSCFSDPLTENGDLHPR